MARSTSSDKHIKLRILNRTQEPVHVLWLDYAGAEQEYAVVQPGCQHVQSTFATHPWRFKGDSGHTWGERAGDSAVLEVSQEGIREHPWPSRQLQPQPRPIPAAWGQYRQRAEACGVPVWAFDIVGEEAVLCCAQILQLMLQDTPRDVLQRLRASEADVGIIGRDQVTSDLPPHSHMKGQPCSLDRTFDQTRGVGGEENVTLSNYPAGDRFYPDESILVHEFAHSVMNLGMTEQQQALVRKLHQQAQDARVYDPAAYAMLNADEYWAELTQSWLDATARQDVSSGVNTRERVLFFDPPMAALLAQVYGQGSWRYRDLMQAPFRAAQPEGVVKGRELPPGAQAPLVQPPQQQQWGAAQAAAGSALPQAPARNSLLRCCMP